MLKTITIHKVASFQADTPTKVDTQKKVCLFYGLNGTGKTTISNFLKAPDASGHENCKYEPDGSGEPEILVYNEKYIHETFGEKDKQPGVFTLGKENKEAEAAIKKAQEDIAALQEANRKLAIDIGGLNQQKEALAEGIRTTVWQSNTEFQKTPLKSFLEGKYLGSKQKYLDKVQSSAFEEDLDYDAKWLQEEAIKLQNTNEMEKQPVPQITLNVAANESDTILNEVIIGSGDSYLAELIQRLSNSDWVKQGTAYLETEREKCPFCQQTLPNGFEEETRKLFNQTYEAKIACLGALRATYSSAIDSLQSTLDEAPYQDDLVMGNTEFAVAKERLFSLLRDNLAEVDAKIALPSKTVRLTSSASLVEALNQVLSQIQTQVAEHNNRIRNRATLLKELEVKFWKLVRNRHHTALTEYETGKKSLDDEIVKKNAATTANQTKIGSHETTIQENQGKITNIDRSIDNINRNFKLIGLEGFKIEKEPGDTHYYRLVRNGKTSPTYRSLSEGEKTLVTFLYFLELCQGSQDGKSPAIQSNRILVIDDPISSLSHNYVYDVASLIHYHLVLSQYRQIILLTHSLFFMHELLQLLDRSPDKRKNLKTFRVSKAGNSRVEEMDPERFQNEYQSYWQILKDVKEGKASASVLPNVMRNILEHYFAFVDRQNKLWEALKTLCDEDSEFRPLYRYVQRESHSSATNLTDFGIIDPTRYLEKFREIFNKTGDLSHYNKMMGAIQ